MRYHGAMNAPNTSLPSLPDVSDLIQHPYRPPATFDAPQPGVFKASTVYFPTVADMRSRDWMDKSAYTYGLHGTPTSYILEERIAHLEGGRYSVLVPSGLAALSLASLALLSQGDHVLLPDNVYGPNKVFALGDLNRLGIAHDLYDPMDPQDLQQRLRPNTRLVWVEAPGSVTMEFPDLPALVRIAQAHGARVALDNTWGAGLAFAPFDLLGDGLCAVDLSAHALSKYPSGGGDVLMGAVTTRTPEMHRLIQLTHMRLGLGVGMNDVESVLRSLPSIGLRYAAQDQTARELAHWWQAQSACVQVLHPALAGAPGHAHWQALCGREGAGRAAGLFSIMLDERFTQAQVDAFVDGLQRFRIGYSWGGPVSLVVPYDLPAMRRQWPSQLRRGWLVRFSVGLESASFLIDDLRQSMQAHLT